MTLSDRSIARIIRRAVKSAMAESIEMTRTTKQLSGTVEQLDEDLDVVWVRLDNEALSADPTQSLNYEAPGIIPATRLGETFTDEQVRVTFDGAAGATAQRTSVENHIVLPFGAEGERIVLDGEAGAIGFYDIDGDLVGYLDPAQWFIGKSGESLLRLDPLGGLRLRDSNDVLRAQLSAPEGLVISDPASGISGLIANHDGLVILDPVTGDRISITSGGTSGTPTPSWAGTVALSPGATHSTPAVSNFGSGDDIDLRFTACSAAANLGAQSYTPPSGWTERTDQNTSASGITLASSCATKDPADAVPGVANFVNTSSAWTRRNGHSVIIRGGGGTSPAFRSASTEDISSTATSIGFDIDAPAGLTAGDLLLAHVSIASNRVPIGWTVPDGWKQLGIVIAGLGTTHILASGIWYIQAPVSPPSMEHVTINMGSTGFTRVQATVVAVSDPYEFPAGLDIRMGNRSMPRGLVDEAIGTAATTNWANAALPQTVETISNVPLLARRNYKIAYDVPNYTFNGLSSASRFAIDIEMDTGSGFTLFHTIIARSQSVAGTETGGASGSRPYVPATNQVISLRARVREIAPGVPGFNIQLSGSAQARRWLYIEDTGAVF